LETLSGLWTEDVKSYSVYIMASASGVLYIGITNDLERRVFEHQNKLVPGFSARYNVRKLVYFELFGDARAAIAREKELKGWLRKKKVALIESLNPQWKDLSARCPVTVPSGDEPVAACHSIRPVILSEAKNPSKKQREILRPLKQDSE
jgi:putative endonuclease